MTLEHDSYLVQRLKKPVGRDNPFSFGGGYKNGGLSDGAMDLIRGIFSFDYMGAAEFEFGAVPKALHEIAAKAEHGALVATWFTIKLSQVAKPWNAPKGEPAPKGTAIIYVLCGKGDEDEVETRIRAWAAGKNAGVRFLKEGTRLSSTLRPASKYDGEVVGWLELDNGYFFFTDEEMWRKTCNLFGVDE